jgi:hypothetical protein
MLDHLLWALFRAFYQKFLRKNKLNKIIPQFRDMEQTLLDRDSRDMYTALLRVSSANVLDEGNYTCQVVDRGVQQCKSLYIEVAAPPIVSISPMSVTLSKVSSLQPPYFSVVFHTKYSHALLSG